MARLAYSYLRFSTPEQANGDSRRRQLALAERYAERHGLVLDRDLSFRDLGVSAFHGRNAREGSLRAFLDAVEHGFVPPGSHLLVESLDRLSRDRVLAAQGLFLQIVQAGVTIVTLVDQRTYSVESLNRNPTDLIISLVTMMRANEESAVKSVRNRAAWANKRARLAERPATGRCPGWLRLNKASGRFEVIGERAEVIRRIYRDALAGSSLHAITRALNREGTPLFGHGNQRGKMWHRAFVAHLLSSPAVIGTFVPRVTEHVGGKLRLHPQPPVPGYYPAVVDEGIWREVQDRRAASRAHFAPRGPKRKVACLLAHLAECPDCGTRMILTKNGDRNWRYLLCNRACAGAGCARQYVRYPEIELLLTRDVDAIIQSCPRLQASPEARRQRLAWIAARLRVLRRERAGVERDGAALRVLKGAALGPLGEIDVETENLLAERRGLRARVPRWPDAVLQTRLEALREAAQEAATNAAADRTRLNAALRALLARVVVDRRQSRLVLHWKHGGESAVAYRADALRRRRRPSAAALRDREAAAVRAV